MREYLAALVIKGRDPSKFAALADTLSTSAFQDAMRFFLARGAGGENKKLALPVAEVVVAMARYWAKADPEHLAGLTELTECLRPPRNQRKRKMSEKSRSRLRQFDDPANVQSLLNLPSETMKDLAGVAEPSYRDALRAQTVACIEILTMCPIRMENLANLQLGRHITRTRNGVMHISIPGEEVKNGVAIEAVLPVESASLIEEYINRYRPLLASCSSDYLWPGKNGSKCKIGLSKQISCAIREETGLEVHAHLFRHFCAKMFLDAHPGQYGVIRLLCGHRSVDTTAQFYCEAESRAAFKAYDDYVSRLRKTARDDSLTAKDEA